LAASRIRGCSATWAMPIPELVLTKGDSHRLAEALAGKGVSRWRPNPARRQNTRPPAWKTGGRQPGENKATQPGFPMAVDTDLRLGPRLSGWRSPQAVEGARPLNWPRLTVPPVKRVILSTWPCGGDEARTARGVAMAYAVLLPMPKLEAAPLRAAGRKARVEPSACHAPQFGLRQSLEVWLPQARVI
jgi:hypothetical protein